MHYSLLLGLGALIGHLKKTIRDHTKKKEENKVSGYHSCLKHFIWELHGKSSPLNIYFFFIPMCALKSCFKLKNSLLMCHVSEFSIALVHVLHILTQQNKTGLKKQIRNWNKFATINFNPHPFLMECLYVTVHILFFFLIFWHFNF